MRPPAYPFLISLYPAASLLAANLEEPIRRADIALVVLLSLAVTAALWVVSGWVTASKSARGLLAMVGAIALFWYGSIAETVAAMLAWHPFEIHPYLLPPWSIATLLAAAVLIRWRGALPDPERYLNLFAGLLLVFALGPSAYRAMTPEVTASNARVVEGRASSNPGSDPDVFVILLDKYSGSRSLRVSYGFDNRDFENALRAKGFFVPTRARANYVQTHLALASMLNWTHLDELAERLGPRSTNRSVTYRLIEDNAAWKLLQNRGYEFIFFPSPYAATRRNRYADRQVPGPNDSSVNFMAAWFAHTPVAGLLLWTCAALECQPLETTYPYEPETAETFERKFASLARIDTSGPPKFVLAHVLLPHEPFIFRADCSRRSPVWPAAGYDPENAAMKTAYVEQIACLNTMILSLVDALLARPEPPAIILQSDHGHGRLDLEPLLNRTVPLDALDAERVSERVDVFAAYFVPAPDSVGFYDDMTPVNVLPLVFNQLFGTTIDRREDRTYWSEPYRPFSLRHVDP